VATCVNVYQRRFISDAQRRKIKKYFGTIARRPSSPYLQPVADEGCGQRESWHRANTGTAVLDARIRALAQNTGGLLFADELSPDSTIRD